MRVYRSPQQLRSPGMMAAMRLWARLMRYNLVEPNSHCMAWEDAFAQVRGTWGVLGVVVASAHVVVVAFHSSLGTTCSHANDSGGIVCFLLAESLGDLHFKAGFKLAEHALQCLRIALKTDPACCKL